MNGNTFRPFSGGRVAVVGVDDGHSEAGCFADEVAVDFPSVATAVERMRRGFTGDDRGETLRAALQLSADEATTGARRPLRVPVRCICRACGGRGETWTEACPRCAGGGLELLPHQLQVSVPAGVTHGARFRFTVTAPQNPPTRIELQILVD